MIYFTTMLFCAATESGKPVRAAAPPYDRVYELFRLFRKQLLDHPGEMQRRVVIPDCTPASVIWVPAGNTAGTAIWTHQTRIESVSVIRSGLDINEDEQALDRVMALAKLPITPTVLTEIRQGEHPLLANLYRDPEAAADVALSTASMALAAAFFSNLGVGEEEPSGLAF
jgi:hypothetical protein